MKNKFSGLLILFSSFLFAQEIEESVKKETKFQVGLHYVNNIRNKNIISNGFNGVIGLDARYAFYKNQSIVLHGGLSIDFMQTRENFFPKDILIWNPNISVEGDVFKSKLKPFFSLGYGFFTNKVEYNSIFLHDPSDPSFNTSKTKTKLGGLTINPGLRFHVSDFICLEGSYKYFAVNSTNFAGTANVHLVNLGLGLKF